MPSPIRHRVLIVGGGFGGLNAARGLGKDPRLDVTLVDRRNHHLFQPLLYQVATGALAPGEIAQPLRSIVRRNANTTVLLGEAVGLAPDRREVVLSDGGPIAYDTLIVATGARHSYFGHDEWAPFAPGLKSIDDATDMRRRILIAFEAAEREAVEARRIEWMTFVVVGGGPTGVELAGALGEIANDTLRRDFRSINPADSRILLVEAMDRVLPTYPPEGSRSAARQLEKLGVTVRLRTRVVGIDGRSVRVVPADAPAPASSAAAASAGSRGEGATAPHPPAPAAAAEERIPARTVLWAAGVQTSSFVRTVANATGTEIDRAGRIPVGPDLTIPGHPEIFVIGDAAVVPWRPDKPVPGVAQGGIQTGKYAARAIRARLDGKRAAPFRFQDRGDVAVIGRAAGVTNIGWLGPFGRQSGFIAWGLWLGIHIVYLIGFANRLVVVVRWAWSFFTHGRGSRLITGQPLLPEIERPEPPA
ncbi:MAG TPA: NAD(P)/FAD-dependent oxidoreductase [Candidatus Eisenbacteria bacterium]|nr:NAD(P)/FAD-dependent oxidoreductase [Candidatus Eisenbacteria bacterium]